MKKKLIFLLTMQLFNVCTMSAYESFKSTVSTAGSYLAQAGNSAVQFAKNHPRWATYIGTAAVATAYFAVQWRGAYKDWHRLEEITLEVEKQNKEKKRAALTGPGSRYKEFIQSFKNHYLKQREKNATEEIDKLPGKSSFNYNKYIVTRYDRRVGTQATAAGIVSPSSFNVDTDLCKTSDYIVKNNPSIASPDSAAKTQLMGSDAVSLPQDEERSEDGSENNETECNDPLMRAGEKVIKVTTTLQSVVACYKNRARWRTLMTPTIAFLLPACYYQIGWGTSWLKSKIFG